MSDAEQGTYFWLLTLQQPTTHGVVTVSSCGTVTPRPGATRLDVLRDVRKTLEAESPEVAGGSVIAFDLQPNQLADYQPDRAPTT